MKLYRPKSLHSAFLAVIFPLTLILAAALFLAIQTNEHNKDHQFLQNKLNDILATHSSVMAMPVWNLNDKRVQVIIEAISQDPDVSGVAVFDKRHSRYGAIGVFGGMTYEESEEWTAHQVGWETGIGGVIDHLRHSAGIGDPHVESMASRERLIFQTDSGPVEVGDLFVAISYENLGSQFLGRVMLNAGVSLFALLLVALCVLFAYRRIVGIPLARLLKVITAAQTNVDDESAELNLKSVGEVDRVINAFHTLQSMQVELEKNLRKARDSLERQVEERTASLLQSKKELETSEKKYRELFENILDVSYQTDAEGNFVLISPSVEKIFGYTPEELIGKKIREFYRSPRKREEFLHELKQKEVVENFEEEINKKNGSCAWVSTNARLLLDEEGNFLGVEGVTRDITQLKKSEEEKKNLQTQLLQAQKMESIGTLAGGIAHDFNNILMPIIGCTEMSLEDTDEGTALHENLLQILKSGLRAKDLVHQILTFSRQTDEELKPLKVQTIIKEVLKLIRSTLPSTIEIRQHISKKCGPVMANATQIHQIAMNLMTNAYHAMEKTGGKMEITLKKVELGPEAMGDSARVPGPYCCLTVSDTGTGMNKAVIERIFDPYFTTKAISKGTGLGLAVVHGIVKNYGGDIKVTSEPGKGTTFHVYFPQVLTPVETRETADLSPLGKGTEKILFVDDEEAIVRIVKQMLERLGYHVIVRTSSVEALEAFRAAPDNFDLVISDMTMPNMTGIQLLQKLKEIRPDIPVIICSGFSEQIDDEKARAMGINAYVMKPVVKNDLAKSIRNALDDKS